jgi:hypothetical protein
MLHCQYEISGEPIRKVPGYRANKLRDRFTTAHKVSMVPELRSRPLEKTMDLNIHFISLYITYITLYGFISLYR